MHHIHQKLLTLLSLLSFSFFFAQNFSYENQWKKVEDGLRAGKFKTTLPLILEVQNHAMKEDNVLQLIQSLKSEFSITKMIDDDEDNDNSSRFYTKISEFSGQLKGESRLVFDVFLGHFIHDYYKTERWEILQRTNINNQDLAQMETWSRLDFKNYLKGYYEKLSAREADLKKVSLLPYKSLFQNGADYLFFPTLLEWNAVNHIEFLKDQDLFTPNERKENHAFISGQYERLILANAGNARLYFQHQKLEYDCAYHHCSDKLQKLEALYNNTTDGDYKLVIAAEIMDQLIALKKNPEALSRAVQAKKQYPKSPFLNHIINREQAITKPVLNIRYQTHTQADLPVHLVAEAKNATQFTLNIYAVKNDVQGFLKYVSSPNEKNAFTAVKKSLLRKETFKLPESADFLSHKTSLELQPLAAGIYLMEYVVDGAVVNHFYMIATRSRIVYSRKDERNTQDDLLKLVNRQTGKAMAGNSLRIIEYARGDLFTSSAAVTSQSASFSLPKTKESAYYRYILVHQPDSDDFNLMQLYGNRNYGEEPVRERRQAQVFLDRAIYRPGQTVYFKAIVTGLAGQTKKESLRVGDKVTVRLHDANGEELSAEQLVTNDFGSVHGSFTLPQGKLNGQFHIAVRTESGATGQQYFRVEEYKRPKFEVSFDPVQGEYKYGQTIAVNGKAMMFSGVALSNATVQYEIKKQDIRWRYFWWLPPGNDNVNSILGEVKTNEKGEFTIEVNLEKDEKQEGIQVDNYQINASVTDINGETQSATENVKVASVSHYIQADEVGDAFADEPVRIKVQTKNYNEQPVNKSYHVKLTKLTPDERIYRSVFEDDIQDLPKLSKEEFIRKFPHDYFSEDEKRKEVHTIVLNGVQRSGAMLELGKLPAGKYTLEIYNKEGTDTISTEQTFELFNKKSLAAGQKPFLKVLLPKPEYKRSEKAELYVYSAVPDGIVNVFVQNGNGQTHTEQKNLKNGVLKYELALPKDENIHQMNVQFQMVAFNDVATESVNLQIVSDKKPLRIETVTFRDRLEPGQKEKWTVKILGEDWETINAEVLANMYDKSLDKFAVNSYRWEKLYQPNFRINGYAVSDRLANGYFTGKTGYVSQKQIQFPRFDWFNGVFFEQVGRSGRSNPVYAPPRAQATDTANVSEIEAVVEVGYGTQRKESMTGSVASVADRNDDENQQDGDLDHIPVRENLNETAFFYPNLLTDKEGHVTFEFTSPEALTAWKLMFLAHTKDARAAVLEKEVITRKEFSVTPNYPRFLREGDELNLQSKLSSLVNEKLSGTAQLQILDAFTNDDISARFGLTHAQQTFQLEENGNGVVIWKLKVPKDVSSIIIKVVAKAGNFADGEQKAVAVLPNRMLVTDAVPVFVKEGQTKTFVLQNLTKNTSTTVSNVANTLELTTNPVWEIMFALPALKNDMNNSADVVFNKWFADVLAAEIFKSNPKLKTVFDEYQRKGLLTSHLEKNQELKQLLLEETPWVLESKNEQDQMQKLARLFDVNTMRNSMNTDWDELRKLQNPDGGFSWYSGYPSSYYTSLYILKNLGRINEWLKGNLSEYQSGNQQQLVSKLIHYVDGEVHQYWDVKKENVWNNYVLDYLDTRRYWEKDFPLKGKGEELKKHIKSKARSAKHEEYTFFGLHRAALLFDAYGLKDVSQKLITYLKETAVESETQGVYWKQNLNDWGWYTSKTVNHAGALEAFNKLVPGDLRFIEEMKIWLVTQKEVNSWGSSRGTAEVIFTLLNSGKSWTGAEADRATVIWGGKPLIEPDTSATGYIKSAMTNDEVNPSLGTVTVTKPGPGVVQGGLFWQYYEDLDKIKSSESSISITKELYKKVKTVNGEELMKISPETPLKVGDRVTVRMMLNTDRNMEFIHLKDMRAAGFEPLNVLSGYQWKNGLGYYQSTKDASTNFYIQYMPKGKYVFEYDYICNASGTFSNGITTLQNYYAPQMNAHTTGSRVEISE